MGDGGSEPRFVYTISKQKYCPSHVTKKRLAVGRCCAITRSIKKRMETRKLETRKFRSNLLNYACIFKTGARKRDRAEMERKAIDQLEAQGVSMQPAPYSYPYDYQVHAANKRHAPPPGSAVDEYPDTSHQVIEPVLCHPWVPRFPARTPDSKHQTIRVIIVAMRDQDTQISESLYGCCVSPSSLAAQPALRGGANGRFTITKGTHTGVMHVQGRLRGNSHLARLPQS